VARHLVQQLVLVLVRSTEANDHGTAQLRQVHAQNRRRDKSLEGILTTSLRVSSAPDNVRTGFNLSKGHPLGSVCPGSIQQPGSSSPHGGSSHAQSRHGLHLALALRVLGSHLRSLSTPRANSHCRRLDTRPNKNASPPCSYLEGAAEHADEVKGMIGMIRPCSNLRHRRMPEPLSVNGHAVSSCTILATCCIHFGSASPSYNTDP